MIYELKDLEDLSVLRRSDKVAFTCERCNKESIKSGDRFKKEINHICGSCRKSIAYHSIDNSNRYNPFKDASVQAKLRMKFKEKYDVDNPWDIEKFQEKCKETKLEKYGYSFFDFEKNKETMIKRYGVANPSNLPSAQEKRRQTFLKNYGVDNPWKLFEFQEKARNTQIKNNGRIGGKRENCNFSLKEKEIGDYVKSFGFKVDFNIGSVIKPLELDVYVEDRKLAIEFNGTYWHSTEHKDKWYHQRKVERCYRLGIRLLHIYEWEWSSDKQACLDKIDYYLHSEDCIEARKPIARFIKND